MSKLQYIMGNESITVLRGNEHVYVTSNDRRFNRLRRALIADQMGEELSLETLDTLLDIHYRPEVERLKRLSNRISYDAQADVILFDNDPLNTELANYIRELCKTEHPQLGAFVNFMERLANNPSEHSRNELFHWFQSLINLGEKMTLTPEGKILAYKGVLIDQDGDSASIMTGPGIVDGEHQHGHLKNRVGSIVEVSRSYVDDNHKIGCSRGLHAGTFSYASGWARGRVLRVEIDPADVVSVPDCSKFQKIRCCRYRVLEVTEVAETLPVVRGSNFSWSDYDKGRWDAGDHRFSCDVYENRGFTFSEAIEIEADGGLDDMDDWLDNGFTLAEILGFKRRDVTLEQVLNGDYDEDEDDEDSELCYRCGETEVEYLDELCDSCEDDPDSALCYRCDENDVDYRGELCDWCEEDEDREQKEDDREAWREKRLASVESMVERARQAVKTTP